MLKKIKTSLLILPFASITFLTSCSDGETDLYLIKSLNNKWINRPSYPASTVSPNRIYLYGSTSEFIDTGSLNSEIDENKLIEILKEQSKTINFRYLYCDYNGLNSTKYQYSFTNDYTEIDSNILSNKKISLKVLDYTRYNIYYQTYTYILKTKSIDDKINGLEKPIIYFHLVNVKD